MADYVPDSTFPLPITLDNGDQVYVARDVTLVSTTSDPAIRTNPTNVTGNSYSVAVDGAVIGMKEMAISLRSDLLGTGNHSLLIGETGIVRSLDDDTDAIFMGGKGCFLGNAGEISGDQAVVLRDYQSGVVENSGTVIGGKDAGLYIEGDSFGVKIVNSGLISGVYAIGFDSGYGTINNTGHIQGTALSAYAIIADTTTSGLKLVNSGSLNAISDNAILCGPAWDRIINHGEIGGEISTGAGNDFVHNFAGTIRGDVLLGEGDDVYKATEGQMTGTVYGDDGQDTITGGRFDDTLDGGGHQDTLRGRAGDDTLVGGGHNDVMYGGKGEDTLQGGYGADTLYGRADDDALFGNAGDDRLAGNRGDDTLTGGTGNDVFVIKRSAGDDVITDFVNGEDQIDLTAFGLRGNQFDSDVVPALSNSWSQTTFLDLAALGGSGSVMIHGLPFASADASDFIL